MTSYSQYSQTRLRNLQVPTLQPFRPLQPRSKEPRMVVLSRVTSRDGGALTCHASGPPHSELSSHSHRALRLAYVFSRVWQWEDFLEAVVRLSLMIALPTDAEIEAVGAQDAGDYLLALRASQHEMRTFIEARKRPWYKEPTQQAGRCVDHLLSLVTRIVELNTRGAKDLVVSRDEANAFARRGAQAIIVHSVESQREEGEFQRALSLVAERLLHTLSQVPLFGGLTQGQLVMLRDSMSEQINEEDDLVITQGDVGDCFFVIIEGSAEAVLERPPTKKGAEPEEELLKTFGQFDFFGERALLKSEPRFCSVRVTSKQLSTFTITQLTFEETMGKSLSQLLPDYY